MATLVLTAVGSAIGGPVGGAIGAILGQQVDARLFAPKARHGPRLGDLAVQTSSYGTAIPKLFGSMRIAGTVIWATDLREERASGGGGKGRPKTVSYSYSASFAVALSARPIRGVRRIWADGKLLRGAAGDFKTPTGFRLHAGDEDQAGDPLIVSVEGAGAAPAYRGTAYAVFEDFQLGDYGNRIPSLSFEVEADGTEISVGAIAEALAPAALTGGPGPAVAGYAASGDSIRGALEALGDLAPLSLADREGRLLLTEGAPEPPLPVDPAGAATDGGRRGLEFVRDAAAAIPAEVTLSYYDVSRDFQTGLQRANRGGAPSRSDRRAVAAAMVPEAARSVAERRLATLWAARTRAKAALPWAPSGPAVGAVVRIEGETGLWRVKRWTLERMVLRLELVRLAPEESFSPPATGGRPIAEADRPLGPSTLHLLDVPLNGDAMHPRAQLLVTAAGREEGWRGADLLASFDGGASWTAAGTTAPPTVLGTAVTALPSSGSALFDQRHAVEVELLNDGMWLEGRSDAALAAGANVAALGDELFQFGRVEALGDRRFRLSRLLRGRRGTEWAADHFAGAAFALIEAEKLVAIDLRPEMIGGEATLLASGPGDPEPAEARRSVTGEALRPPAPVHLKAIPKANGDLEISWVRRSRLGWVWSDGGDAPLGEESELYRLNLSRPGFARSLTTTGPEYLYPAGEQAADGMIGPLAIEVCQLGTFAASRSAAITVN